MTKKKSEIILAILYKPRVISYILSKRRKKENLSHIKKGFFFVKCNRKNTG